MKIPEKEGDIFDIIDYEILKYCFENKGESPPYIELANEQYRKCVSNPQYVTVCGPDYPPREIFGIPIKRTTDHTKQSTDWLKYVSLSEDKNRDKYNLIFQFGTFGVGMLIAKGDNSKRVIVLLRALIEEIEYRVKKQEG